MKLFTFMCLLSLGLAQKTCFSGDYRELKLGLPPSVNATVTGYLPINWSCDSNSAGGRYYANITNAHGVFVGYFTGDRASAFGLGSSKFDPNIYQMYFGHRNQHNSFRVRICKWPSVQVPTLPRDPPVAPKDCLVDKQFQYQFAHKGHKIYGVTFSGDRVRIHSTVGVHNFYVPGASNWDTVAIACDNPTSCYHSVVTQLATVRVQTDDKGLISSFEPCQNCEGFAENVFAVEASGKIPSDFSFNNWFLLTNSSSVVDGKVRSLQPLKVLCLRAVPSLLSTKEVISLSGVNADKCNGHSINETAGALRFNLNFTSNPINALASGKIFISSSFGNVTIFCSNSSDPGSSADAFIAMGSTSAAVYCFANSTFGNVTSLDFIGVLPVTVREFVFAATGQIYINGFNYFSLPDILSVDFDVKSDNVTDFWTVAYTQFVDTLVAVNNTLIQEVLYCDDVIHKLKCSQLSFDLPDGFYSASLVRDERLDKTFVTLPTHSDHSNVTLYVSFNTYSSSTCTTKPDHVTSCQYNVTIVGENDGPVCVKSKQFTPLLQTSIPTGYYVSVESGSCPFNFLKLKNYLTFDSLCFSTKQLPGGCSMLIKRSNVNYNSDIGVIYVSHSPGNNILGVPQASTGVKDLSYIVTDVCTDYTIYGKSGKGVIRKTNSSLPAGIMYTSESGSLLGFKNVTDSTVYTVTPCATATQLAVYKQKVLGAITAVKNDSFGFNSTLTLPLFYYHSNGKVNCTEPILVYSSIGICPDGTMIQIKPVETTPQVVAPIVTANISIPLNFTTSVQVEYLQLSSRPVSVDCATYVCNGNPRCLTLLTQYSSACKTAEEALQLTARLEASEVNSMIKLSPTAIDNANKLGVSTYQGGFNLTSVVPQTPASTSGSFRGSFIEDLLFNKVITSGLGTVDADYKECTKGLSIADLACAQYYNGIMVLPGVVDAEKMAMYTASLTGAMVMGGLSAAASIPFSLAVQSRLNYVALQTDVLQENQKILAASFNKAIGSITQAFTEVNDAIAQTSQAIGTVAGALNKIQGVVNEQGQALSHLTKQLQNNFQAISSSIEDIYNRLDSLAADAQVDRLITGRLAALNSFVTQTLTRQTQVRASRELAMQKINECVKSQSDRYGFCGNGTHLFSIANAAPEGLLFLHTVLVPDDYVTVEAWSGICFGGDKGFILRDFQLTLIKYDNKYKVTSRKMFQPRNAEISDFIQISNCDVQFLNLTQDQVQDVIPEYVDVNKTLEEALSKLPNYTKPDLSLDVFNQTYLNLSSEIDQLEQKAESLTNTTIKLQSLIDQINSTLVDLEWLNRVENYIKWPWWVWLIIAVVLIFVVSLLMFCCIATGGCGCCSCMTSSLRGCCDCGSTKLPYYEFEKVHVQ
ncbi:S protein [NL63-related bat coronavirus]|uniref:S protein n=1 Tax=NL63-related bat coronavirus TaxID=1920748 RepID=A0A1L2KGB2_9ALPC|nr:S protein [NL63-related bat coronavirus]APD51475.1 S protein [NL63-related bat coronavirus]